jgi:uncharacterized protein with von Willebrand factor type A (vWA) domain
MQREITRFDKGKKSTLTGVENLKKITENMKEQYLSDISQKTMFDEVYRNQI